MDITSGIGGSPEDLPVIIIGAGPVGLAAAAHLHSRGQEALILEAGEAVGTAIRRWGHVQLFSPWRYLVDVTTKRLLESHGWRPPDPETHPSGQELVGKLLEPLAALPEIAPMLRLNHRVTAVTRLGLDRLKSAGRDAAPFLVAADGLNGQVRLLARAVIDASGTWMKPNPLGSGGIPADGESKFASRITYRVPAVFGDERLRYEGKRTLVVGSGHSAFNAVIDLAELASRARAGEVVWAVRRQEVGQMFGGAEDDQLAARGALGDRARLLVEEHGVMFYAGFQVAAVAGADDGGLVVTADDGRRLEVDEIVATTGFRPDLDLTRELRLALDPVIEAPVSLAPLIDPNVHSCGSVPPHGEAELAHPEARYYTVGMKSYGRAPTFLLLTGYEQVRSIAAYLAGDLEAARRVELELPTTGVCSSNLPGTELACCGPVVSRSPARASPV